MSNNPTENLIINKDIFRAYDIRGKIGEEWCLNNDYHDAYLIGYGIGTQLVKRLSSKIIVGRDGRLSSDGLTKSLIEGLIFSGCEVFDIGLVATPVTYFAISHLDVANAVMVTGSHNPADHNGIKIVYESSPISSIVIETIYYDIINTQKLATTSRGTLNNVENIIDAYQKAIIENITLERPLKIGIDCSNGATSLFSESLFSQLNCEVYPLFCELDGTFPNHSPDPTVPENLEALSALVKKENLDLGIAFDGDGDRMIAVDNQGKILWPDRIMILLAQSVLANNPSAPIVFDVKCSFLLPKAVREFGGQPSMCVSGHSILKMQMKRLNAAMGGEFSGHIVMPDRWSFFDDGPYVAARLLEVLSKEKESVSNIFKKVPDSFSTPEYKIHFEDSQQARNLLEQFIQQADFSGADLSLIDGLRVDYKDGWGLIRSSNTTACLTLRFEAHSEVRLLEIQNQFKHVFSKTNNRHSLPF